MSYRTGSIEHGPVSSSRRTYNFQTEETRNQTRVASNSRYYREHKQTILEYQRGYRHGKAGKPKVDGASPEYLRGYDAATRSKQRPPLSDSDSDSDSDSETIRITPPKGSPKGSPTRRTKR